MLWRHVFIRYKGKQICDPYINIGLPKQSCRLASVVSLMIEKMHQKAEEVLVCNHTFHACICQHLF